MPELALDFDVHAVGEAVAGMMARRDFENSAISIEIASEDPKTGTAPTDLQPGSDLAARRDRLNVLSDAGDPHSRELFELPEDGVASRINPVRGGREIGVNVSVGDGDRRRSIGTRSNAAKARPASRSGTRNLFSQLLWQADRSLAVKGEARVASILQDLANIRKRLVKSAPARGRRLNDRARPATARDQTFRLENSKRLADGEPAYRIFGAQHAFRRKSLDLELAAENLLAKVIRELKVARLADASGINCRAVRHNFSLRSQCS